MPIVTRLYVPDDFGVAQVLFSITGIIVVVSSLRYELAIVLPEKDEDAINIVALSSIIVFNISIIILILIGLFRSSIARLFDLPELISFIWFVPVIILLGGVYNILQNWSSRRQYFGLIGLSGIYTKITDSSFKLGAGALANPGPFGLIGAQILGSIVGTIVLFNKHRKFALDIFKKNVSFTGIKNNAQKYRRFPIYDSWSGLLNSASSNLPIVLLAFFFSSNIVGYFALSMRVLIYPLDILWNSISKVFYQKAASEKNQYGSTTYVVEAVYKRLFAFGLFPMLCLVILGKDLFEIVFGARWIESGVYIQYLAPWLFLRFISSPLSTILLIEDKQKQLLYFNIASFISRLVVIIVVGYFGDPRTTILFYALTSALLYLLLMFYILILSNVSVNNIIRYITSSVIYCILFLILLFITLSINLKPIVPIIIAIFMGAIYYLLLLKKDSYIKDVINGMIQTKRDNY